LVVEALVEHVAVLGEWVVAREHREAAVVVFV
jgi:hypothetical protein